jgi:3-oxoacyl-[acyl-carrier protein] reductase
MAKAAEETLVRSLAREVSGSGVTANLVVISKLDAAHERETAPSTKNASWATPEEVAETIVFLASPAAAAVNGARIPLYGRS